jgi:hypothetical protein
MEKINIACVYKTGGDYDARYVEALTHQMEAIGAYRVARLVCLTDDRSIFKMPGVTAIDLENGWPGWWSVPEVYRVTGPTMVVGLDHVFLKPIDHFAATIHSLEQSDFIMMRAFAKKRLWASGIMAWHGDWRWLYRDFDYDKWKGHEGGEQDYARDTLMALAHRGEIQLLPAQRWLKLVSYKKHVRKNPAIMDDADMILFHGLPRPHQVKEKWVKKAWLGQR